jgi:hypothetical protein
MKQCERSDAMSIADRELIAGNQRAFNQAMIDVQQVS